MDFDVGSRVIFRLDNRLQRGRVTKVLPQRRRIVTDSGRRVSVPARRLRYSPDRVLILETPLDRALRTTRSYGLMMQQWLAAYGVDALYERVHTIGTVRRFLSREGKNIATRYVHIMGHGFHSGGQAGTYLKLTFERLHLVEQADIFRGLDGKIIIFSCCGLGANRRALEAVKEASGAAGVIAYRVEVEDWYTNLSEALLYDRLLNTNLSPQKAVELVNNLLDWGGIRLQLRITRRPVLVCV